MRGDSKDLQSQRYHGVILKDLDPLNKGRYKVWISELMYQIPSTEGIWCKNRMHKSRVTKGVSYGTYHPLQPGTQVLVGFYENDFNNGFILERENDQENECLPFKAKLEERDKIYLIQNSTEERHTLVMFDDGTTKMPEKSIHLYVNHRKHKLILNEKGVHLFVTGDFNVSTTEDMNFNIKNNIKIKCGGNLDIKSGGHINNESSSNINLKTSATVNIEGGSQNHKGSITSDYITGTITYADIAGSLGPKPSIKAPSAETAADNTGYDTKSPKEIP